MNSNIALEIKELTKTFDGRPAVKGVSLEILKGECFGILGPNGAGKSTLVKMLYGSVLPTSGDLYILGLNAGKSQREIKARIGVIPQEDGLDSEFTARENLLIYSRFHGIDGKIAGQRVDELLRQLRIEEYADRYVQTLSGGIKRRLVIARGMLNRPDILFLDEPTIGLDPQARLWIWSILKKIKEDMGTLVLTTHYIEEAEQICDRIAIIESGVILALGSPKELIQKHVGNEVLEFDSNLRDLQYDINRLKEKKLEYQVIGSSMRVFLRAPTTGRDLMDLVASRGMTIRSSNLNDVFLKLAGHDLMEHVI